MNKLSVFDLFSKRQKKLRGELPDVYQYTEIPHKLRVQIIHIVEDALGSENNSEVAKIYKEIHQIFCKEYGKFFLTNKYDSDREYKDLLQSLKKLKSATIFIGKGKKGEGFNLIDDISWDNEKGYWFTLGSNLINQFKIAPNSKDDSREY